MGVLTVVLKQLKDLRDKDGFGKSDPYVILELQEDKAFLNKGLGKHQSSTKQGELNPVYNETFKWEGIKENKNLRLKVKVKDEDIGLDDYLGSCEIDIDDLGLDGTPMRIEKSIDRKRGVLMFSKTASIIMEIKYTK